jgi:hypothetical protein
MCSDGWSIRGIGATQRSFAQALGVSVKTPPKLGAAPPATDRPRPRPARPLRARGGKITIANNNR